MITTFNKDMELNAGVIPTSSNVYMKSPLEPASEKSNPGRRNIELNACGIRVSYNVPN